MKNKIITLLAIVAVGFGVCWVYDNVFSCKKETCSNKDSVAVCVKDTVVVKADTVKTEAITPTVTTASAIAAEPKTEAKK